MSNNKERAGHPPEKTNKKAENQTRLSRNSNFFSFPEQMIS